MKFSPRGQTNAQRAALWHAIGNVHGENQDLRLQLAEERRARLELTEVVASMRRGQEPRGGVSNQRSTTNPMLFTQAETLLLLLSLES
ncbi:hypothetical protein Tco_0879126 [Tanacetum coccineum]